MRDINPPGQGGRILNIASVGGFLGQPTGSYYHAGKFGESSRCSSSRTTLTSARCAYTALEGLTESFARELLPEWNGLLCE